MSAVVIFLSILIILTYVFSLSEEKYPSAVLFRVSMGIVFLFLWIKFFKENEYYVLLLAIFIMDIIYSSCRLIEVIFCKKNKNYEHDKRNSNY